MVTLDAVALGAGERVRVKSLVKNGGEFECARAEVVEALRGRWPGAGTAAGARRTFYEPNFRTRTFLNIFFESSMGTAFC